MKLELLKVSIKGVKWGGSTEVLKDGTLQVSKEDLLAFVADDDNLKSINADIALPGESVRIVPVKDVIEPRYKIEGGGQVLRSAIASARWWPAVAMPNTAWRRPCNACRCRAA